MYRSDGYLKRAVKDLSLMQTKEQLRLVTLDLMEQLKEDGVIYAEIRFAPLLHIAGFCPKK
jgi:adenosine deaminase